MENPVAARELLDEYLPASFKNQVDLATIKLEKESFVEKNLKKQLSDVVLSVKTKDNDEAFVYMLLEAQVDPDYWIALRLWKYILLLCERHSKGRKKLPLICPLVFYHGTKKYDSPKSFWELFAKPEEAKDLLGDNYQLIDLQAMSDEEINYEKHLSMILYMMKHAHQRDKLKLIEEIFKNCSKAILIDQKQDYVYTKLMIWYNDCKVSLDKKQEFEQLILDYLPKEDGEEIMKTIADGYIEEGINKGVILGEARGMERGGTKKLDSQIRINSDSIETKKGEFIMSQKRKTHSAEFKSKIALAAIREEGSLSELSARFGVNANMISKWKKQALSSLTDIFSSKHEVSQISNDQHVKELHAKIGELTVEKDFLQEVSMKFASGGGRKW